MLGETTAAKKSTGTPGAPPLEAAEASVRGSDYVNVPNDSCQHAPAAGGRGDLPGKSAAVPGAEAAPDTCRQPSEAFSNASDPASDSASDGGLSVEGMADGTGQSQLDNAGFNLLVQRVNAGDMKALTELRAILDRCPGIWQQVGDLASHAELSLMRLVAGENRLLMESLRRKVDAMKSELSRPGASALEVLAVQRIVACWLQVQHLDTVSFAPDLSVAQGKYWGQRQDQAHRRYLSAVKQLTTLRQLLPVNVGGDTESALAADGATPALEPAKSDVIRSGNGQCKPQPDDQGDGEFRKRIIPIADAAAGASG